MVTPNSPERPPLCRPVLLPDEWIETYLFRVARANGVHRPWQTDIELYRPLLPATTMSRPDGFPVWGGAILPKWSVTGRASKIRYCPACMQQSRYIRARWRLATFEVCTIHLIRLKDDLIEPAITANYRQGNRRLLIEVTDDQLWDGAVCPMPIERAHVERLWSGFEQAILDGDIGRVADNLPYIVFVERMLDALVTGKYGVDYPTNDAQRSLHRAEFVAKHKLKVIPTLEGIHHLLDQIAEPAHRRAALAQLRRLLVEETRRPTCLSSLPVPSLRDRLLAAAIEGPETPTPGGLPSDAQPADYVSLEKAEILIGCRPRLLRHLIHHNKISGVRVVARGMKRFTFLPQQEVEACRRWYHSIKTPEDVMRALHIDRRSYQLLVGAGLLQPTMLISRPWYKETELIELFRRLDDVSRPCPAKAADLHPLFGEWIYAKGYRRLAARELLKELVAGKIPIFRRLERPGLSAFYVDHRVLARMHQLRSIHVSEHRHRENCSRQLSLLPE
ncbi:TniQ family protein [Burkholderia gladioli]|uniref:TniQ family protein n=1 Tax=Burkholderia gladioli TaxID=28095 RepID=UPI003B500724